MNWFSWVMWNIVGPMAWVAIVGATFCVVCIELKKRVDSRRQKFYDEYRSRKRWPDA